MSPQQPLEMTDDRQARTMFGGWKEDIDLAENDRDTAGLDAPIATTPSTNASDA
jgi:hypothetical protein